MIFTNIRLHPRSASGHALQNMMNAGCMALDVAGTFAQFLSPHQMAMAMVRANRALWQFWRGR